MSLQFKSKRLLTLIAILISVLLLAVAGFWKFIVGTVWTRADFQVLDFLYQQVVKSGYAPESSPRIVYLNITDDTYNSFGKTMLDDLAKVNEVLAELSPEAVVYDIIFVRSNDPDADQLFAESIKRSGKVYLPMTFEPSEQERPFLWKEGIAYQRLQTDYLKQPIEKGNSSPVYAIKAVMQVDELSEVAYNSGHINASTDPDGVYRHHPMLIKVDTGYIPTLSLSVFLDYVEVSFDEVFVDWGHEIRIPAMQDSYLEEDVVIPIDERGQVYIPFTQIWGKDFEPMFAHNLLEYARDVNLQGNLAEFFEGKFVFIGDVSQGASDIGQTPLEDRVPLIAMHTALLNGLLTNRFYHRWPFGHVMLVICVIAVILALVALPKPS